MSTPNQMYDHMLDSLSGPGYPTPYALTKKCVASESAAIVAGMVCSLTDANILVKGLAAGAMALFAFNGSGDFDAQGDDGNIMGNLPGRFYNSDLTGGRHAMVTTIPATAGVELESTEFDTEETYLPNTKLSTDLPAGAAPGVLKPGTLGEDDVVGVCSGPATENKHGKAVIQFWPVYLPAASVSA